MALKDLVTEEDRSKYGSYSEFVKLVDEEDRNSELKSDSVIEIDGSDSGYTVQKDTADTEGSDSEASEENSEEGSGDDSDSDQSESESKETKQGDPSDPLGALRVWMKEIEREIVSGTANKKQIEKIVSDATKKIARPKVINVVIDQKPAKQIEGLTHFQLPLVLKTLSSGCNIALTGSTATSKTTMLIQAAKALGIPYWILPVNEGTTKADILGYMSAAGDFIQPMLYRAMKSEIGGLLIIEEIDSGSPASLLAANNAVDNREMTFPNGETVTAHPNFMVACTMNTKGTGSDRKFVGRNRLDAATLDRFVFINVERDLALEAGLLGLSEPQKDLKLTAGGTPTAQEWLDLVRARREQYSRSHPDKIVSMRATRDGWKLLQAGIGLNWVESMCITK